MATIQNVKPNLQALLAKAQALPTKLDTSDATATASTMLAGETAYVNGVKVTGTMPNNDTISKTIDGLNTKTATIPSGYTSGGTVTVDDTVDNIANNQATLLAQAISALENKAAGSGGEDVSIEVAEYSEQLDELKNVIDGLPNAGSTTNTCTVIIRPEIEDGYHAYIEYYAVMTANGLKSYVYK